MASQSGDRRNHAMVEDHHDVTIPRQPKLQVEKNTLQIQPDQDPIQHQALNDSKKIVSLLAQSKPSQAYQLKKHHKFSNFRLPVLVAIYAFQLSITMSISNGLITNRFGDATRFMDFGLMFLTLYFILLFSFMWKGVYSKSYHGYLKIVWITLYQNILKTSLVMVGAILVFRANVPQSTFVLFTYFFVTSLVVVAVHVVIHQWILYLSKLGYFHKKVLLVGTPDSRVDVTRLFQDAGGSKEFAGCLSVQNGTWEFIQQQGVRYQGVEVLDVVLKNTIGEIIFFLDDQVTAKVIQPLVLLCKQLGIGYYLVPDMSVLPKEEPWKGMFQYIPVIDRFSTARDSFIQVSVKRIVDLVLVSLSMLVMLPLFGLIALLIKLEDGGPVFYVSKRIGKNGVPMNFYKFRSMVTNAEKLKAQLMQYNQRKDGPLFKMKNDPRVTRIGRILRKYSIDELPQLLNVLKGDMSLVGPRPHLPSEVEAYSNLDYLRLECIPGITCLPQVRGRNTLSFREWVDLDLEYRKNWMILQDFLILKETFLVVFGALGKKVEEY